MSDKQQTCVHNASYGGSTLEYIGPGQMYQCRVCGQKGKWSPETDWVAAPAPAPPKCYCKVHPCFHDMTPEDQEAARQSWVRGEMELTKFENERTKRVDPAPPADERRVQGERRKHHTVHTCAYDRTDSSGNWAGLGCKDERKADRRAPAATAPVGKGGWSSDPWANPVGTSNGAAAAPAGGAREFLLRGGGGFEGGEDGIRACTMSAEHAIELMDAYAAELERQIERAHAALDTAGIARGACGHSVRYRIGMLAEERAELERRVRELAKECGRAQAHGEMLGKLLEARISAAVALEKEANRD